MIICWNCHKSMTLEPFTILSLSLPASGKCTLANLLENYHKECSIDYNCRKCNKGGKCVRRIFIQRLPPILVLHLNRFEYISARKKQNYGDFPLRWLSLGEHALSGANLASYDLCAVSNHHGTRMVDTIQVIASLLKEMFGTSVMIKLSPDYEHQ